jgi:serine/threonine protein kinase
MPVDPDDPLALDIASLREAVDAARTGTDPSTPASRKAATLRDDDPFSMPGPFLEQTRAVVDESTVADREVFLPELLGDQVDGRFRLLRLIADGGMAAVYEGVDDETGVAVAVKLLHVPEALPDLVGRFRHEARICEALDHPLLVRTLHHGAWQDHLYIVMELLRGESLRERMNRSPTVPMAEACAIGALIAEGLEVAHSLGVVHRDIKPENVFLTEEGLKILDFGIAKSAEISMHLSATDTTPGTPAYIAPEKIRGKAASAAADLWSLGVVLYEALTGRKPFDARRLTTLLAMIRDLDPPTPSVHNPTLPVDLERLILSLLDKNPADRPAASQVAQRLRGYTGA